MINQKDYVIFLTGCVNPNGMSFTAEQNPLVRQKAYIDTINYYLNNTKMRVVFCENSNTDFSYQIGTNLDRFEFIVFDGNFYDRSLGKGYGEWIIVDYAMKHSRWLSDAKFIVKITGKLIIHNLLRSISWSSFVYNKNVCNLCTWRNKGVVDSRCFVASQQTIHSFLNMGNNINDSEGYYFENQLHDVLIKNKCDCPINACDFYSLSTVEDFIVPLQFDGYSWTSGNKYDFQRINGVVDELGLIVDSLNFRYNNNVRKCGGGECG